MVEIVRKKRERVYEQIVEQIQQLIRDKVLSPGDQLLPERQLAEKLGVSRAALREALTVLVSRGLIEITPGGGAHVRESSIEDLVDPLAAVMLKERAERLRSDRGPDPSWRSGRSDWPPTAPTRGICMRSTRLLSRATRSCARGSIVADRTWTSTSQ